MNRGAMQGQQLGHSEVPTGEPSALRSTMTVGNPDRAQFCPPGLTRLRMPFYGFSEGGSYGRATYSFFLKIKISVMLRVINYQNSKDN